LPGGAAAARCRHRLEVDPAGVGVLWIEGERAIGGVVAGAAACVGQLPAEAEHATRDPDCHWMMER
jgi:hypothetical protein